MPTTHLSNSADSYTATYRREIVHGGGGNDYLVADGTEIYDDGLPDWVGWLILVPIGFLDSAYDDNSKPGRVILYGEAGNDTLVSLGLSDLLYGGSGNDNLYGGGGDDWLEGGSGDDLIETGSSDDDWKGDVVRAGSGNDKVYGEPSAKDELDGGDDYDELHLDNAAMNIANFSLALGGGSSGIIAVNFEELHYKGGAGSEFVEGGDNRDVIWGGGGADTLSGLDGDDGLYGQAGDDFITGGDGNDKINGGADNDHLLGGEGSDEIVGDTGNDVIRGNHAADSLWGGAGDDIIFDDEGDDEVHGEAGADQILTGAGRDTIYGGDHDDDISEHVADQPQSVGGRLFFGGDTIYGEGGNDRIDAGAGYDYIDGGSGVDFIHGGIGNDQIYGGTETDVLYGEDGDDLVAGGHGDDYVLGNAGRDDLFGEAGRDGLYGGDGNDSLSGGFDGDWLYGGAGVDRLEGGLRFSDAFIYEKLSDSLLTTLQDPLEVILDFEVGRDKFDVSQIDADVNTAGNQTFQFVAYANWLALAGTLTVAPGASPTGGHVVLASDGSGQFLAVAMGTPPVGALPTQADFVL